MASLSQSSLRRCMNLTRVLQTVLDDGTYQSTQALHPRRLRRRHVRQHRRTQLCRRHAMIVRQLASPHAHCGSQVAPSITRGKSFKVSLLPSWRLEHKTATLRRKRKMRCYKTPRITPHPRFNMIKTLIQDDHTTPSAALPQLLSSLKI